MQNDPNEAGCQLAHSNRTGEKLKGQVAKTRSGSIKLSQKSVLLFVLAWYCWAAAIVKPNN